MRQRRGSPGGYIASVVPCPPCPTTGCQLVCNPNLEQYSGTIFFQSPANFVSTNVCSWGTPGPGSPDYFNTNFLNPRVQDTNFAGSEAPHSGDGYGGIYCYYSFAGNYREYIQHQLQAPLIAGQWYTLTFWVSLADYSGNAVNHLGAYISTTQPTQTFTGVINVTPQVYATTAITTINGWVPVTGNYQATGGEQWITIGSFEIDLVQQHPAMVPFPSSTNPFFPNPPTDPNRGAYYYIDDITLSTADPCFNWFSGCGIVSFYHNSPCDSLIVSESWDFDDPSSGVNNTSALPSPSHIFTQSNVPYNVVHTIYTANTVLTCTVTVVQTPIPVAQIVGYQTNNCGSGFLTYTANPCQTGIVYSWIVTGGTPSTTTGCSTDINWGTSGGYIILSAWDSVADCTGYDTLKIPACCDHSGASAIRINNTSAKAVLNDPVNAPYISGTDFIALSTPIIVNGIFTIDTTFTFLNCYSIDFGANALTYINPGETLTYDSSITRGKCDTMWDGNHISDVTATLNVINGSILQQAKRAVYSINGGRFNVDNSLLRNNYKDIVVDAYGGTHPGRVVATKFTQSAPFLPAIPALPLNHTKTVCAIEIVDNADITYPPGEPRLV